MPRRPRPPRPLPELTGPPAPAVGQAAEFQGKVDKFIIQFLGAMPLLLPLFQRLDLRGIVNRHVEPSAAEHDPGLVVLLLVLNRLLAPLPLQHVETWLETTALPAILSIQADEFNDDHLARALDLIAPHLEAIWQDLAVQAIVVFNVDLSELCYDITSISFTGNYEQAELIRYGYSRDHRPDLKQVELAANVTVDGGVPIDYRVLAGNVADRKTPVENLTRLRELLDRLPQVDPSRPPVTPLVISDRAMLTPKSIFEYDQHRLRFLGPYDAGAAGRILLAGVKASELAEHPLQYRPQRPDRDQSWQPYQGVLRTLEVVNPNSDEPKRVLYLQALVVWSPAKAKLDGKLRDTNLQRLEATLRNLAGKLNRRPYTKRETVEKRLTKLLNRHPARRFLSVSLEGEAGDLRLAQERCQETIDEAAHMDGRYLLVTNDQTLDPSEMLRLSKRRDVPEKRFSTVQGPLEVRPVYVHKQERVLGLVFCTMVTLLAYPLIELQCARVQVSCTAEALIKDFASVVVVVTRFVDGTLLRQLSGLQLNHLALLHALDLPPPERYAILNC